MKYLIMIALVLGATTSFAQTTKIYQNKRGNYTQIQLDSMVAGMQNWINNSDQSQLTAMAATKEVRRSGDTVFYSFSLKAVDVAALGKQAKVIGTTFPDFTLKDLENTSVSNLDLRGKPVVINLWFTSCAPCVAEMPGFNDAVRQHKDVQFIAMTYENAAQVKSFLAKQEFAFRQLTGATDLLDKINFGYPTTFFIDKEGVIRDVLVGATLDGLNKQAFNAALEKIKNR